MAKGGYRGGMPMGGMNQMQMMKQAQKMQQDLLKMQQEMEEKQYEATAGGGVIRRSSAASASWCALRLTRRQSTPTMWKCCRIWSLRRSTRQCARQRLTLRRT